MDGAGGAMIEDNAKILAQFYAGAYDRLYRIINEAAPTLWKTDRNAQILAQLDDVLQHVDVQTKAYLEEMIPQTYRTFAGEVKTDLQGMGVATTDMFSTIHEAHVQALAEEAYLRFAGAMKAVKTNAEMILPMAKKAAVRQAIAEGQIIGLDNKVISENVQKILADQGIISLKDAGGKAWQLDAYADMLTRTVLANTARDATKNQAAEYGYDLVQISAHGGCEECAPWEGVICSINGDAEGYPSLDEAEADGLFHPNCKHTFAIVPPDTPPSEDAP